MRLLPLLLLGCAAPAEGQKVRALLVDEKVYCVAEEEGGPAFAEFDLTRDDELYLAEIVDNADNVRLSLPAVREGLHLTFACPEGLDSFTVRRAIILADQAPRPIDTPTPPGAP